MKTIAVTLVCVLWASFARADVIIIPRRPAIFLRSAPAVTYVAPAPSVAYVPAPSVAYSAPAMAYAPAAAVVRIGPTAAQRRHARKAAGHARKAEYWASRS